VAGLLNLLFFLVVHIFCIFAVLTRLDMSKYNDSGYVYSMSRVTLAGDGSDVFDEEVDIEDSFYGLVVKSVSGLDLQGTPRLYEENWAESDKSLVYVPQAAQCESTEITLTIYVFDPYRSENVTESISTVNDIYHKFLDHISGCKILYRDTVRKRKALLYLSDSPKISSERVCLPVYKEVELSFKNVYGRSFGYDEELP